MTMRGGILPPKGLIALKKGSETLVCWEPVGGAAGYNVYARADEAADGNYSELLYEKLNDVPVTDHEFHDISRLATYRVTAVDEEGEETELSDMVFPVAHEGVEILSIRYFTGDRLLLGLPDRSVRVKVTAVNSSAFGEIVNLRVCWDGQSRDFTLSLPCDGMLHEYEAKIGAVKQAPITACVLDSAGKLLSCFSRFRPLGRMLYDTLFEKGLLVCEPQTATLYDENTDQAVTDDYILDGKILGDCHIQFELCPAPGNRPFKMEMGSILLTVEAAGSVEVRCGETVLGVCGQLLPNDAGTGVIMHVYAGSETLQVFRNNENIPALTAKTRDARGAVRFLKEDWEMKGLRIVSQKASFAGILPMGCQDPDPVWDIACWWSRYNWIRDGKTDPVIQHEDQGLTVHNPGRSLSRLAGGGEIILRANGSVEYEHTRRREEGWTHLLLEVLWDRPNLERIGVLDLKSLWMTMDIRLVQCENKTDGYEPDIHAGQFVVYFNISGTGNEAMWLGLCNMDSRYPMDENRRELVCQMDPGTNTFIIAPPEKEFITGHLADGQWHSMSLDLKPVILRAFEHGKSIGAFVESTPMDLKLNSMNLGFEIPGTFDMAVKLSNLQLVAENN